MRKLSAFLLLTVLLVSFTCSFVGFVPESRAQNGEPNNVTSFFNMNLTEYWQTLNQHSAWDLEWYNISLPEWVSIKSDLTVQRQYSMPDMCKLTLLFNASQSGDYRLTFGIDLRVKRYVQKLDQYQYELTYEGVSVIFDWSDVIGISGLVVTHGIKNVDGNDYFWCRMQRDNVPQGTYLEIDPSVNIKPLSKETYYPSSYNAIGSTTPVSGSITDLQADDGVYATFRSYPSANGSAISLGYSTASTTGSTTIESQIVGSLFTLSQNAWATQIMAYVGVTTAAKNAKCMIYRHSNLALMGTTAQISLPVATAWRTFTFTPYIWLPADEYIIDVWSATGSGNGVLYYATGTTNQGHIDPQTYGTVPNPLVPTSHNAFKYDVNCTLIPPSEYICDLEFIGTSNTADWLELIWGSDCSFTTDSVTASFQLYNYNTSSYPQSGDGFMSDTMGNVDVNKTQTITANPSDFRDASGNWKVKVKAVKSTNQQFDLKADFVDPTVIWTAVSVTSVHTCPLDQRTFIVAYSDEDNDDVSFQIYDTNGTQLVAETDVDTTAGSHRDNSVGVSAFNDTYFVVGWYDSVDYDATFTIYNRTGSLKVGPTDADTDVGTGYSVSVSCFNSTYFVIGWHDETDADTTFAVYDSDGALKSGPTDADTDVGAGAGYGSVSVSAFNSTYFVIGWADGTDQDITFSVYDSSSTLISGPTDVDADVGTSYPATCVSTFNSTHFVIGYFDSNERDATWAVYDSNSTLYTGPIDADTAVGLNSRSVQVCALNSTAFVISYYDSVDFDLTYLSYLSNGTAIAAMTDIESWPTSANIVFRYNSPCSQETATGIALYNANWIIAYANTTTQAIWQAFMPNGTAWDGTIPSQEQGQNLAFDLANNILVSAYNIIANALAFQTSSTIFPSSNGLFWKALPFQVTGAINFFESTSIYKALAFLVAGIGNFFSSFSKGMSLSFQPTVSIVPSSANYFWKAIGFQTTTAFIPSSTSTMNKAIGFLTTGTVNLWDSMSRGMSLTFQATNIIYLHPFSSFGKETATTLFEVSDLAKLFSSLGFNMAKGFSNYDLIHPSGNLIQNKALGFSVDSLLRLFSDASIGIGRLFSNFETMNPFSSFGIGKELSFNVYGLPQFFDNLGMTKSIRVTFFELSGLLQPFANALASFQITVVVPTTNLPLVLGGFAVVMVFVCLALVLDVQGKKRDKQTR